MRRSGLTGRARRSRGRCMGARRAHLALPREMLLKPWAEADRNWAKFAGGSNTEQLALREIPPWRDARRGGVGPARALLHSSWCRGGGGGRQWCRRDVWDAAGVSFLGRRHFHGRVCRWEARRDRSPGAADRGWRGECAVRGGLRRPQILPRRCSLSCACAACACVCARARGR